MKAPLGLVTGKIETQKLIDKLFAAELQFRLASAVRVAVSFKEQPLDLPTEWVHGQHRVVLEEIALRQDQAEYAAHYLFQSSTLLMATAIKNAIRAAVSNPKNSEDERIQAIYQVARLIRNAFAHHPFSPIWSIDTDCQNKVYRIPEVISLDTTGLNGIAFDWRHHGGPLALFRMCRLVRFEILGDEIRPRTNMPPANKVIHQQGNLLLLKVDGLPPDARPINMEELKEIN